MAIYSGFSHWKWWFSIAMLNYQRVWQAFTLTSAFCFMAKEKSFDGDVTNQLSPLKGILLCWAIHKLGDLCDFERPMVYHNFSSDKRRNGIFVYFCHHYFIFKSWFPMFQQSATSKEGWERSASSRRLARELRRHVVMFVGENLPLGSSWPRPRQEQQLMCCHMETGQLLTRFNSSRTTKISLSSTFHILYPNKWPVGFELVLESCLLVMSIILCILKEFELDRDHHKFWIVLRGTLKLAHNLQRKDLQGKFAGNDTLCFSVCKSMQPFSPDPLDKNGRVL